MRAATERAQLRGDEQGLVAILPSQEQRRVADRLHAAELARLRGRACDRPGAGLARTVLTQGPVRQYAVVTVAPVDPDGIPSDLAELSYRRCHGCRPYYA